MEDAAKRARSPERKKSRTYSFVEAQYGFQGAELPLLPIAPKGRPKPSQGRRPWQRLVVRKRLNLFVIHGE
jgi:hypothetical protein